MKRFGLVAGVLTVGILFSACSQAPAEVKGGLEPQFGTKLNDRADAVVTDAKRGYTYVGGVTEPGISDESLFLRSFDASGKFRWERRINCCAADFAEANAVRLDAAGNVYVGFSGDGYDDGNLFGYVLKVSPANKLLYKFDVEDDISDFEVDRAGNVYLTGTDVENPTGDDIRRSFLRKYDTQGKLIWERLNAQGSTKNPADEIPVPGEIALTNDGSLHVIGFLYDYSANTYKSVLTKYSNAGHTIWQKSLYNEFKDSVITASGRDIYLATNTGSTISSSNKVVVQKYNTNGSMRWQKTIAASDKIWITASAVDANGNLYLSGGKYSYADADLFAHKYTPSGTLAWTYAPRKAGTDETARAVSARVSGSVYLAGTTTGKVNGTNKGNNDAFLLRLNPRGQKVWER